MTTSTARSRLLRALVLVVGLLSIVAAYFAVTALLARRDLTAADHGLTDLRKRVAQGDTSQAGVKLRAAQGHMRAARRWLGGPLWSGAEHLPWVGDSVTLLRGLTTAVDGSVHQELAQLVAVADAISPDRLRRSDGSIDLRLLATAAESLAEARQSLLRRQAAVAALPSRGALSPLRDARERVVKELQGTYGQVDTAWRFAKLAPPMLGLNQPRRYFVGIQNNAELRATGGNIGAYAVLIARAGKLTVERSGSSLDYRNRLAPLPPPTPQFVGLYGTEPLLDIRDANQGPHFPYAGELWRAHWRAQTGETVDGAIAVDPVTLSALLGVVGGVTLPGGRLIDQANIVDYTLRKAYAEIQNDPARKDYLQLLFRTVFTRLDASGVSSSTLSSALGKAAGEHHLQLWSAHPEEQAILAPTPLAAELPENTSDAEVTVNNGAGGKLDYYLHREVTWATTCLPGGQPMAADVTVALHNAAPAGLPPYVVFRADLLPGQPKPPIAQNRSVITLYAPAGAHLQQVRINGRVVGSTEGEERGHPASRVVVTVNRGETVTVTYGLILSRTGSVKLIPQPSLPGLSSSVVRTCPEK
jgi:hypothetical protein